MGTQATPRPWTVEQAGKPSPLDEDVCDASHNHVNLYQHLDLIVSAVNNHDALVAALAWALPYAKEHAERGSQCCGAAEHSEAEGICGYCREHTGFDNPDLEHAQAALKAAGEATS